VADDEAPIIRLVPKGTPEPTPEPPGPDPELLGIAEGLLQRVLAREVEAIMLIVESPGGTYDTVWSGTDNEIERIGYLEKLKHDILSEENDE
jgi:hypothetical protein